MFAVDTGGVQHAVSLAERLLADVLNVRFVAAESGTLVVTQLKVVPLSLGPMACEQFVGGRVWIFGGRTEHSTPAKFSPLGSAQSDGVEGRVDRLNRLEHMQNLAKQLARAVRQEDVVGRLTEDFSTEPVVGDDFAG
ncbi:MAG: hypothetical protein QF805_30500, partial [Pirellulaceae bacterium]|nr:hypothetical protein [Pirellulaceae bacterium]